MLPVFNHVAPYRHLISNMYLSVSDSANPYFLVCCCRTWISLDIARFYDEQCCHPAGPISGCRRGQHNLHSGVPDRCDSSTPCRLCGLEPIHVIYWLVTLLPYTCANAKVGSALELNHIQNLNLESLYELVNNIVKQMF